MKSMKGRIERGYSLSEFTDKVNAALTDIECRYADIDDDSLSINYYVNINNYNYYNGGYQQNVCAYFKATESMSALTLLISQRSLRETDRDAKREVRLGIAVLHGCETVEFIDIDF